MRKLDGGERSSLLTYSAVCQGGVDERDAMTGHPVYDREPPERHWTELIRLFDETLEGYS